MIRKPAVAGRFYEVRPEKLRAEVSGFLKPGALPAGRAAGFLSPHAGYAYSGAAAGADPDVGLVVAAFGHQRAVASMVVQSPTKSGRVLSVVPTSSTSTPGTASPITAPAVAIRWSA